MSCTLVLGPKNYSSWSMRAWLLLKFLEVPFDVVTIDLYTPTSRQEVRDQGGESGLVPVLRDGDLAIWDTPAIFEHFHETHPQVWPAPRDRRARARSLCGEVHSGFHALRAAMPVNTRARGRSAARTAEVTADIDRVVEIWTRYPAEGGWLFDEFGGADIMFAPIATRFQTYGVSLSGPAADYQARILAHPLVAEWLRLGAAETGMIPSLEVG
jgi:glutathione S-transferase